MLYHVKKKQPLSLGKSGIFVKNYSADALESHI